MTVIIMDSKATDCSILLTIAGKEWQWEWHLFGAYRVDLCERENGSDTCLEHIE